VAVLVGHNWPMQLRFRGGKGIAVSLGGLLVYDPFIVLCVVAVLLPLFVLFRSFTLAGMLAYTLGPLVLFFCGREKVDVAAMSIVAILVVLAHRRNIRDELGRLIGHRGHRPAKGSPAPMHKGPNEET